RSRGDPRRGLRPARHPVGAGAGPGASRTHRPRAEEARQGAGGRAAARRRRRRAPDRLRRAGADLFLARLRRPCGGPARPGRTAPGLRHRRRRRSGRKRAPRRAFDPRLRAADLAPRPGPRHAGRTAVSGRDDPGRFALSSRLMRRGAALLLTSCSLLLALAGPAASQRAGQANAELTRLQAEYRDETARARRLRAEAAAAAEEIVDLDRQLRDLRRAEAEDDVQLEAQRARLKELAEREAALVAALSRERAAQGRLLSALQMMSRKPPPTLLIPADQAVDTVRASILIRAITPDLQKRAETLVERQVEIGRIRRLAALSSERLFTVESAQNDRRAEIEGLTARKTALRSVLRAEAARAE